MGLMTRFLLRRPAGSKSINPLNSDLLTVKLLASVCICEGISHSNYNSTAWKTALFIAVSATVASRMAEEQVTRRKEIIL